jgi:acyl-coenzyme A thioesterase PaaI-like protein
MLYDTVGPNLLATLEPDQFQATDELHVRFLRPTRPGRLTSRGRIVRRDGDRAFIEARLFDADDRELAVANATARVIPLSEARAAV